MIYSVLGGESSGPAMRVWMFLRREWRAANVLEKDIFNNYSRDNDNNRLWQQEYG